VSLKRAGDALADAFDGRRWAWFRVCGLGLLGWGACATCAVAAICLFAQGAP